MNTTSSIFVFDHGQKKLNKAIGIEESYLDDLQEKIQNVLKNHLFDEDKNLKDDISPSLLVEACLHQFSYNQLVLMSSFFMQDKLEQFGKTLENKIGGLKKAVKKIALDAEEIPPHIREMLEKLADSGPGSTKDNPVDANDLPPEIKDFLDGLIKDEFGIDDDGDDD